MKNIGYLLFAGVLILSASCSKTSEPQEEGNLEAGVGVVNITADSADVLDSLRVKALALRQGNVQGFIIECDVTNIASDLTTPARKQIAEATGIPFSNIAVAATHTHSCRAHTELVPAIVEAAKKAWSNLRPVELASGIGQEAYVAHNRRYFMKDGSVMFNPMFLNPNIVKPAGTIDPFVQFVLFKDASNGGQPFTSITNYAIHPDIVKLYGARYQNTGQGTPNTVSEDYPHWIEVELKKEYGDHFNSIYLTGCCGDINQWDFSKPGPQSGVAKSKEVGDSIIGAISKLPGLDQEKPSLAIRTETVVVPLRSFSEEDLEWAKDVNRNMLSGKSEEVSVRKEFLNSVARRRILWLNEQKEKGNTTIPIDVQVFRLTNNTAIVTLPGEMFVQHGLTVKNNSPFEKTIVMELTNYGEVSYVPTKLAFREVTYEVENSRLAPGGGEMLTQTAIKLLKELKPEEN